MPFINVKTNVSLSDAAESTVKTQLGHAIAALPGKSEAWLMVELEGDRSLWFAGTGEPAAMVSVAVYGGAPEDAYDTLTGRICDILNAALGVEPDRIYVCYTETPAWGWNGSNF